MSDAYTQFETMKRFIGFGPQDAANLARLGPIFAKHGPAITDRFYAVLADFPETARLIEGRVDLLKATHAAWMGGLFSGDYGEAYLNERLRIGQTHVRVGLDPFWVEGVMDILRCQGMLAIASEVQDPQDACQLSASLIRILDLDLLVIGQAYAEERLDRLSKFTGMKRTLIENAIRMAGRKN
jgi:hypothetical protein